MPGIVPPAPPPMMWSMRFLPSAPLEFASPVGKRGVFELRRMRVDSSVEAHRKTTRARNSSAWWVWASMTRDRKSTRLNSSHLVISNAVFCLKKKNADCTYDFRQLAPFVARFREGNEFVMGSRWKGSIEPGSMPPLHRYLGTPVTTWVLNVVYGSRFSDIHCGMRGITRSALERMGLQSQSWEYASEMVLKSVHMRLRTTEVPVR